MGRTRDVPRPLHRTDGPQGLLQNTMTTSVATGDDQLHQGAAAAAVTLTITMSFGAVGRYAPLVNRTYNRRRVSDCLYFIRKRINVNV